MTPIKEIRPGEPITAAWLNGIVRQLRAFTPQSSGDIAANVQVSGTTYRLKRRTPGGSTTETTSGAIWQPYQFTPDPEDPQDSDWRTIGVTQGFVNNIIAANTSNPDLGTGTDWILDAASTYHAYLKCSVHTSDDALEGTVTAVTLFLDTDFAEWPDEPAEPSGDSDTGAPPSEFFIKLYDITTGSDNPDDDDYQVLTLPTSWSKNNFWVDEVSFGQPVCVDGKTIIQQRMSARAV